MNRSAIRDELKEGKGTRGGGAGAGGTPNATA